MASEPVGHPEHPATAYRPGRNLTASPHPRVLIHAVDDPLLAVRLSSVCETVHEASFLSQVDLNEWDCVVTNAPWAGFESHDVDRGQYGASTLFEWTQHYPAHMSVIHAPTAAGDPSRAAALDFVPAIGSRNPERPRASLLKSATVGTHVSLVDGLPDALSDLVRTTLVPAATNQTKHVVFTSHSWDQHTQFRPVRPLLFGPGGRPIAVTYARSEQSQVWLLPPGTDLYPWVLAALREWHTIDPYRYPTAPGWQSAPKWLSRAESQLRADLVAEKMALAEAQRRFDEEERRIGAELTLAAQQADQYERALVSSQGELLAAAVVRALAEIGFDVQDMDAARPDGSRHEDFRLTDPDAPGWDCIGEVKGFTGGVRETGLTSLQRHLRYFEREQGRPPSAQWYVANSELRRDPDLRPAPLTSSPEAVVEFAEDEVPGVVVDTRALYALLLAVQSGRELAVTVRAWLRAATGVLGPAEVEDLLTADHDVPPPGTDPPID